VDAQLIQERLVLRPVWPAMNRMQNDGVVTWRLDYFSFLCEA